MAFWRIQVAKQVFLARTFVAFFAFAVCTGCAATSRMGEATVKQVGDSPCFAIAPQEEARRGMPLLQAVVVSDESARPAADIWWTMLSPGQQKEPISAQRCLVYGEPIKGGKNSGAAPTLVPGKRYSVFINARPADGTDPTFGFVARFCVTRKSAGQTAVHEVLWDEKASRWNDDACGAPAIK